MKMQCNARDMITLNILIRRKKERKKREEKTRHPVGEEREKNHWPMNIAEFDRRDFVREKFAKRS